MKKTLTDYPNLMKEWDYEKNKDINPELITYGSSKRVWWICSVCGYEWDYTISNRTILGRGCPECAKRKNAEQLRKARAVQNNLAEKNPLLVKEWDYEKNLDVPENYACGSDEKVWWKCSWCGNEWLAQIKKRALRGDGCPQCGKQHTSLPEQTIYYYCSKYFEDTKSRFLYDGIELDVYIPSLRVGIEFDGSYWHKGEKNLQKDNIKDTKCKEKGIQLIRIRDEKLKPLHYSKVIAFNEGSEKSLQEAIVRLLKLLQPSIIPKIDIKTDLSSILASYEKNKRDNSLAVKYPDLAREWNDEKNVGLTPESISWGYGKKVWWKCPRCGSDYQMTPNKRTNRGSGCPICSAKKVYEANQVQIRNDDTGEVFDSLTEAALSCNGRKGDICYCCNGKQKTAFGYHWSYVDITKRRKKHFTGRIRCVENNMIFENDKEAAKWCEGDNRNINAVCNGRSKTYRGYHWEYYDNEEKRD